jgi:hypothetical protein
VAEDARRHAGAFALGKCDAERGFLFVGHGVKLHSTDREP